MPVELQTLPTRSVWGRIRESSSSGPGAETQHRLRRGEEPRAEVLVWLVLTLPAVGARQGHTQNSPTTLSSLRRRASGNSVMTPDILCHTDWKEVIEFVVFWAFLAFWEGKQVALREATQQMINNNWNSVSVFQLVGSVHKPLPDLDWTEAHDPLTIEATQTGNTGE